MKKSRLYLWLLLLTGGLNACNSSETVTADTGNNQQVRLGVNINHGVKTRANFHCHKLSLMSAERDKFVTLRQSE